MRAKDEGRRGHLGTGRRHGPIVPLAIHARPGPGGAPVGQSCQGFPRWGLGRPGGKRRRGRVALPGLRAADSPHLGSLPGVRSRGSHAACAVVVSPRTLRTLAGRDGCFGHCLERGQHRGRADPSVSSDSDLRPRFHSVPKKRREPFQPAAVVFARHGRRIHSHLAIGAGDATT